MPPPAKASGRRQRGGPISCGEPSRFRGRHLGGARPGSIDEHRYDEQCTDVERKATLLTAEAASTKPIMMTSITGR